jgi:hypothetical protein
MLPDLLQLLYNKTTAKKPQEGPDCFAAYRIRTNFPPLNTKKQELTNTFPELWRFNPA